MFLLHTKNRRRSVGTLLAGLLLLAAGCGRSRTVVTGDGKDGQTAPPQMTMLNGAKEQRQVVLQITDSDGKRSIMQPVADKK
jgi:hypothetical protein